MGRGRETGSLASLPVIPRVLLFFSFPSLAPYDTKRVHYGQNGELQCFKTH